MTTAELAKLATATAAIAAMGSWLTAWTAQRHRLLEDIVSELDAQNYVSRFWHLHMYLRDTAGENAIGIGTKDNPLYIIPLAVNGDLSTMMRGELIPAFEGAPIRDRGYLDGLACDLFGPPWSYTREDLYRVYTLVTRLAFWAGYKSRWKWILRKWHVKQVLNRSGVRFINVMTVHRDLASRLQRLTANGDGPEHYRTAYGLEDRNYHKLFDSLVKHANAFGMPLDLENIDPVETRLDIWGLRHKRWKIQA